MWTSWHRKKCRSKTVIKAVMLGFRLDFFAEVSLISKWIEVQIQNGHKLELLYRSFQKNNQENCLLTECHLRHKKYLFLNQNSDQELIDCSRNNLRYQIGISTEVFPKTTSKYLPSETNLASVAQTV